MPIEYFLQVVEDLDLTVYEDDYPSWLYEMIEHLYSAGYKKAEREK